MQNSDANCMLLMPSELIYNILSFNSMQFLLENVILMNGESGMVGWQVRYLFHYKTPSHLYYQHVLTVNHALSNLLGFCLLTNACYFIFIISLSFDRSNFILYAANLSKNGYIYHYHNNSFLSQMGQVVILRFYRQQLGDILIQYITSFFLYPDQSITILSAYTSQKCVVLHKLQECYMRRSQ